MTDPKTYDVTCAMATMLLASADASNDDLKGMLVAGSDIPEDRLDFALAELTEGLDAMRQLVRLQSMLNGRPMTVTEVQEVLQGATWIDDDKGTAKYNTTIVDPDGDEVTVAVTTKIKRK